MIKKIKISRSEKIILIFIISLGLLFLTSLVILKNKCLFVKNYNPYEIQFDKPQNIVVLNANCGNIIIELFPNISPNAVERFKTLIKSGAYNDVAFHRVIENKLIQAGDLEFGKRENLNYGKVGTGMSQSSGVFTFPSTGFWLITFNMRYGGATNDARYIWSKINTTVDNSSYDNAAISYGNINPGSSYWYGVNECKFIFDVTNTSTHKVKFSGSSIVNDMKCYGNSSTNETYATFMKLGDT